MITLRLASQWITFFISSGISLVCLYSWWKYRSCTFGIFFLYGIADVLFYTVVLVFKNFSFGNDISPFRSVFQDSIILSYVLLVLRDRFAARKH